MIANFAVMVNIIVVFQFGFLIYDIQYSAEGQTYAADKLAVINVSSQVVSLPLAFLIGYLTMKGRKVWRMTLTCTLLCKLSTFLFVKASKNFTPG